MTYYWNRLYFEGLKAIGEAHVSNLNYELFGKYCLQKEQGLKKIANNTAVKFVSYVQEMPLLVQKEIVIHLCQLSYDNPDVHSLINHSLSNLIHSVLKSWSQETPNSIEVYRWYARYCFNESDEDQSKILERALEIDPNDHLVLTQSINQALYYVEYMVHHLNENLLLGEPHEAQSRLDLVKKQLPRLIDDKEKAQFQTRFDYYETLFRLWETYISCSRELPFIDWAYEQEHFVW